MRSVGSANSRSWWKRWNRTRRVARPHQEEIASRRNDLPLVGGLGVRLPCRRPVDDVPYHLGGRTAEGPDHSDRDCAGFAAYAARPVASVAYLRPRPRSCHRPGASRLCRESSELTDGGATSMATYKCPHCGKEVSIPDPLPVSSRKLELSVLIWVLA